VLLFELCKKEGDKKFVEISKTKIKKANLKVCGIG